MAGGNWEKSQWEPELTGMTGVGLREAAGNQREQDTEELGKLGELGGIGARSRDEEDQGELGVLGGGTGRARGRREEPEELSGIRGEPGAARGPRSHPCAKTNISLEPPRQARVTLGRGDREGGEGTARGQRWKGRIPHLPPPLRIPAAGNPDVRAWASPNICPGLQWGPRECPRAAGIPKVSPLAGSHSASQSPQPKKTSLC